MTAPVHLRSYGRRRGHRLRVGRQTLLDTLLPSLRVAPPVSGGALDVEAVFEAAVEDLWLEVGFGAGEHLAAQALAHPGTGMIGCEPFINGVGALLSQIRQDGITNIRIFDDDARLLLDVLPDAVLGRVFVLFSDPWPKKRHHKRRFINRATLDSLARTMKDRALLRFATDHQGYVRWALGHLIAHPAFQWQARRSRDWRQPPPDWSETRYQQKARRQGRATVYLDFHRRNRG